MSPAATAVEQMMAPSQEVKGVGSTEVRPVGLWTQRGAAVIGGARSTASQGGRYVQRAGGWLWRRKETKTVAVYSGIAAGAVTAVAVAPAMMGFTATGVAASSAAAAWQASIGNVVAGSTFAWLQSVGVTGLSTMAYTQVAAGSVAATGGVHVAARRLWRPKPDKTGNSGGTTGTGGGTQEARVDPLMARDSLELLEDAGRLSSGVGAPAPLSMSAASVVELGEPVISARLQTPGVVVESARTVASKL